FPITGVEELACEELGLRADELMKAEREEARALGRARDVIRRQVGKPATADATLREAWRGLKKGRIPRAEQIDGVAKEVISQFSLAREKVEAAWRRYESEFGKATAAMSLVIARWADSDLFREAIIWQNHNAYHAGIKSLLRGGAQRKRTSRQRQNEELVASY